MCPLADRRTLKGSDPLVSSEGAAMTNAQASEAPIFSRETQSFPTTDAPGRPGAGHGRRNLVLGLVTVAVAAVTVGGVQYARVSSQAPVVAHGSNLVAEVAAMEAYKQGGSVYSGQVPPRSATADQSAFVPGGSVYSGQVPSAATADQLGVRARRQRLHTAGALSRVGVPGTERGPVGAISWVSLIRGCRKASGLLMEHGTCHSRRVLVVGPLTTCS